MKIAKVTLKIDPSIKPELKNHLQNYWKFKDESFVNSPKSYCDTHNLNIYQFRKLIEKHSSFKVVFHCAKCERKNTLIGKTQNDFKTALKEFKAHKNCLLCKKDAKERNQIFQKHYEKVHSDSYLKAIENKIWRELPKEELLFLKTFFDYTNDMEFLIDQEKIHSEDRINQMIQKLDKLKLLYAVYDDDLMEFHLIANRELDKCISLDSKINQSI